MNTHRTSTSTQAELLKKLNEAVAAANEVEKEVETAKAELVSRSRVVGLLLLEAKKLHPALKDFKAFLKKVNGLKLSRAYDLMKLAGGRTTDEELRQETRDRVRKHREKKKLPKPVSVTDPDVTETPKRITQSPEISAEERRAQNAALDPEPAPPTEKMSRSVRSRIALFDFRVACQTLLPQLTNEDWDGAAAFFDEFYQRRKRKAA